MTQTARSARVLALAAALAVILPPPSAGQTTTPPVDQGRTAAQPAAAPRIEADAREVRQEFIEILRRHPPAVARVMKVDPSLMRNETYLAPYPGLKAYLDQHPEIAQNASFYLEHVQSSGGVSWREESPQLRMIEGIIEDFSIFLVFLAVTGAIVWLIHTVLEQRRWNRLSKIQAEVHTKLMDRFSANDELMAYVQTPSGRRFLESGPSPLQETATPRTVGAPFSRILWSVQAGVVLGIAGIGALFVSRGMVEEAAQFFFVLGVLGLALGAGFVLSAAASYGISRKLGLLEQSSPDHA